MAKPIVIKISGHELDDEVYVAEFAGIVAELVKETPIVVVHGGGKTISAMQQKMGIEPRYVDGIRITDAVSLLLVEMVLGGAVNKMITRALINAGVDAAGMSGVDRGLIRAEKMLYASEDMGFTGVVTAVRVEVLEDLLDQDVTPVIAPICLGKDSAYNVNADQVAGAIAGALDAEKLYFLSNVSGVLVSGSLVESLTPPEVEMLIGNGTIFGGMIPKVRSALDALESDVKQAVITDLNGLKTRGGTVFSVSA
jgi:acetylglutamate kinase